MPLPPLTPAPTAPRYTHRMHSTSLISGNSRGLGLAIVNRRTFILVGHRGGR